MSKEALNPPAQQEPVAYLCENAVGHKYFRWKKPSSTYKPIALYTAPAQRTWVGLTDAEILKLAYPIRWQEVDDFEADKAVNFAQMVEAKLRSKNNE